MAKKVQRLTGGIKKFSNAAKSKSRVRKQSQKSPNGAKAKGTARNKKQHSNPVISVLEILLELFPKNKTQSWKVIRYLTISVFFILPNPTANPFLENEHPFIHDDHRTYIEIHVDYSPRIPDEATNSLNQRLSSGRRKVPLR